MKNTIAVSPGYSNVTCNVTYSYNYFVSKPAYQVVMKEAVELMALSKPLKVNGTAFKPR